MGTEDSRRNRNGQFIFKLQLLPCNSNSCTTDGHNPNICLEMGKLAFLKHHLCTQMLLYSENTKQTKQKTKTPLEVSLQCTCRGFSVPYRVTHCSKSQGWRCAP